MGKHTKKGASRKIQGEKLIEFAKENRLYMANTMFRKEDRRKATRHGMYTMEAGEKHERKVIQMHNQSTIY